jgi:dienelactone hydrolase
MNRAYRAVCMVVSTALLVGCAGGSGHKAASTTAAPASTTVPPREANPAYARNGPYPVAMVTLISSSGRTVHVMYPGLPGSEKDQEHASYDLREALRDPAAPALKPDEAQIVTLPAYLDLPPAEGPFPVVVFSHGYGAVPLQSSTLVIDLAAWGFVVIAPDHVERNAFAVVKGTAKVDDRRDAEVLRRSLDLVAADEGLRPLLDLDHVAAVGYAQGGATAIAALARPEFAAAVGWASVAPTSSAANGAGKPVMLIGARQDFEFGTDVQEQIYAKFTGPKRLVLVGGGAGHATFVDECESLRVSGLLAPGGGEPTGDRLLDLSQNGCHPDEVDPVVAWPTIVHFTVAELRTVFGIDRTPVGLGDKIASAFEKVPLGYEHRP